MVSEGVGCIVGSLEGADVGSFDGAIVGVTLECSLSGGIWSVGLGFVCLC